LDMASLLRDAHLAMLLPRPKHFLQEQGDKRLWFSIASMSVA